MGRTHVVAKTMPIYKGPRKGVTLDFTRINTSRDTTPEKYLHSFNFNRGHEGQKVGINGQEQR